MHRHLVAAILSLILLATACSRESARPTLANETEPPGHVATMSPAEFTNSVPVAGGPAGYVSSESCKECHADQYGSWHRSYHRSMTQFAGTNSIQADFYKIVLTNETTRFKLSRRENEYWVRMEHASDPHGLGEATEIRLGLVTGSHHMQVFWVPEGHGNMQIGFPFTWLIPEKRWVPRHATFIRPPDMPHRPEVWNIVCSRCHTTGVEPRADMSARRIDTHVGEMGIACEACHGPAQRHVEARYAARQNGTSDKLEPGEIIHPEKLDPIRASQICGFCHSMKWIPDSEDWRDKGFTFRPGDDLDQTTPIIRPKNVAAIDGLAAYLSRNPDLLDDFFWPDGMVRVSGREYNGLIDSPCYKGGKFSCLSCHSLHDSDPDDQLSRRAKVDGGNGACIQCHDQFKSPSALAAHTHHRAESSGSACYNCHMPHTTYGVLKAIRSHQISSPSVADELASGRPNACNLCHLDKPLSWTAQNLQQWYQQSPPPAGLLASNLASIVQFALLGDAGHRALAAWHLGWEPALEASGTNWPPAVLAQLLDDPYAAVRLVAERALRETAPDLLPPGFDFTTDPRQRSLVRDRLWTSWTNTITNPPDQPALLLSPSDLALQASRFEEFLLRRQDRPIRLRE